MELRAATYPELVADVLLDVASAASPSAEPTANPCPRCSRTLLQPLRTLRSRQTQHLEEDVDRARRCRHVLEQEPAVERAISMSGGLDSRWGGGGLFGIVGQSVWSWRVEVESSVGSRVEYLVEAVAGGEIEGAVRFVGQSGLGVAGRTELGGDAPAGEHGVPGGARSG